MLNIVQAVLTWDYNSVSKCLYFDARSLARKLVFDGVPVGHSWGGRGMQHSGSRGHIQLMLVITLGRKVRVFSPEVWRGGGGCPPPRMTHSPGEKIATRERTDFLSVYHLDKIAEPQPGREGMGPPPRGIPGAYSRTIYPEGLLPVTDRHTSGRMSATHNYPLLITRNLLVPFTSNLVAQVMRVPSTHSQTLSFVRPLCDLDLI